MQIRDTPTAPRTRQRKTHNRRSQRTFHVQPLERRIFLESRRHGRHARITDLVHCAPRGNGQETRATTMRWCVGRRTHSSTKAVTLRARPTQRREMTRCNASKVRAGGVHAPRMMNIHATKAGRQDISATAACNSLPITSTKSVAFLSSADAMADAPAAPMRVAVHQSYIRALMRGTQWRTGGKQSGATADSAATDTRCTTPAPHKTQSNRCAKRTHRPRPAP
jgi:hypothetical protein